MNLRTIRRALISVSDKTGIVEFARNLLRWKIEIISTGGTLKTLQEAGIQAIAVSDVTGFPEILDGRVKTLHPKIHAGLLAVSENPTHQKQLQEQAIEPIDLLVVNLYQFEEAVTRGKLTVDQAIEHIDVGGPAMLRAAAKNFKDKTVVVNPARYASIIDELGEHNGAISEKTRFALAQEVFAHTARYDAVISRYLTNGSSPELPDVFTVSVRKSEELRYGENPHQRAAVYGDFPAVFQKLHGKELSYNNIADIEAASGLVAEFSEPTVVIVKHTNPCGAGSAKRLDEAYEKAFATDTKSAFGGIVAVNRPLDMHSAEKIDKVFTEVIIAPGYDPGVLDFLRKKKDRRLIHWTPPAAASRRLTVRNIAGGFLVQTADDIDLLPENLRVVTRRQPTDDERSAMRFAWRVAKHVKSNAIVFARADRTIGIGAGQMSRFDSSRIAAMKAKDAGLDLRGCAAASDAFFPFPDGLLEAVAAGATAVIQPGGSVRDEEVIKAADEHGIAMLFTGIRHFRH